MGWSVFPEENPPIAHLEGSSQPRSDRSGKGSLGSQGTGWGLALHCPDLSLCLSPPPAGPGDLESGSVWSVSKESELPVSYQGEGKKERRVLAVPVSSVPPLPRPSEVAMLLAASLALTGWFQSFRLLGCC